MLNVKIENFMKYFSFEWQVVDRNISYLMNNAELCKINCIE